VEENTPPNLIPHNPDPSEQITFGSSDEPLNTNKAQSVTLLKEL